MMLPSSPGSNAKSYLEIPVAVLGAAGFIGRWVARALCEQGAKVNLIVRDAVAAGPILSRYGIQGSVYQVDLLDHDAFRSLFQKCKPVITFNLAGYGVDRSERDERMAYLLNAALVEQICNAVAAIRDPQWQGQDLIHAGSALEYGTSHGNLAEDSVPQPTTLYGRSKLAGTYALSDACKTGAMKGITARLFTVYGPGERSGRLLPALMEAVAMGEPLPLTEGKQKRDFTYVPDVAQGLLQLGLSAARPGEVVNVATGHLTEVREFVTTAAGILGIPQDRLRFGDLPTRLEEMEHSEVTIERLRQLTGWTPATSIAEGIRKTIEFERRLR